MSEILEYKMKLLKISEQVSKEQKGTMLPMP